MKENEVDSRVKKLKIKLADLVKKRAELTTGSDDSYKTLIELSNITIELKAIQTDNPTLFAAAFYTENFAGNPMFSILFYGDLVVYNIMMNTITGLKEHLSSEVSANYQQINIGVLPLSNKSQVVNEVRLKGAHNILNDMYNNFTEEQIIKSGLLNLAVFYMHEELVDKFLKSDKVEFSKVANVAGARDAKPINFCASSYNADDRHKRIFDKLYASEVVRSDLNNNKAFWFQLLDNLMLDKVIERLADKNFKLDPKAIASLANGLSRLTPDTKLDEPFKKQIQTLALYCAKNEDSSILSVMASGYINQITNPEAKKIFATTLVDAGIQAEKDSDFAQYLQSPDYLPPERTSLLSIVTSAKRRLSDHFSRSSTTSTEAMSNSNEAIITLAPNLQLEVGEEINRELKAIILPILEAANIGADLSDRAKEQAAQVLSQNILRNTIVDKQAPANLVREVTGEISRSLNSTRDNDELANTLTRIINNHIVQSATISK